MREVFGAWDELPDEWRELFTANGRALLAEQRGGERVDLTRLDRLNVPALVITATSSPEPIRHASEALARALTHARSARVRGDHAIDPAGADVMAFVREVLAAGT